MTFFEVLGTLKKNFALVLSGNGLKRKKRSFLNFCKKTHVKKKIFGRNMAENGRKMRFFPLFSKTALTIFFKLQIQLEGIVFELLQKTACQKNLFWPRYGRKRPFLGQKLRVLSYGTSRHTIFLIFCNELGKNK